MKPACKAAWRPGVVFALLLLSGCASYSDGMGRIEQLFAEGKSEAALKALDEQGAPERDRVLYLLNRAMILHMAGDYRGSNLALEQAKPQIERNAVSSVSEQAGALSVNDSVRAYAGAWYERIFVHLYAAMNYLALDQLQEARVEALQLDAALEQADKKAPVPAGFAHYLSGMIFEATGEWDDAMIDYRKAYEAYRNYPDAYRLPIPTALKADLMRVAARQGFTDEIARYREEFGNDETQAKAQPSGKGNVTLILQSGLAPMKHDTITSVYAADGRLVTIALPYYRARTPEVSQATVHAAGQEAEARTDLVEEVDRLAAAELESEMPLITTRAIARAVVKNKAIKQSAHQGNDALGLMMNVAGIITERADTRSWSMLPARIYVARLPLPPGQYDIVVDLRDAAGMVVGTRAYNNVTVKAEQTRFISLRWVTARNVTLRDAGLHAFEGRQGRNE